MTRIHLNDLSPEARKQVEAALGVEGVGAEGKRTNKYGARKTEVDGIVFDSQREANRYCELKRLGAAGEIADLELQPRFPLVMEGGKSAGEYIADFRYRVVATGRVVVEDAKGYRTALYRHKKRAVEAQYGVVIEEV
jgi:CRISPR/Cas system CSM-associated protein Csm4 (group 5 of RAMP superfamily)